MLTKNYKERMIVEDICSHPWIARMEQEYIHNTTNASSNQHSQRINENKTVNVPIKDNNEHVTQLKGNDDLKQDDAFELAVNNVKHKKRKVNKSNTNKKINTSLNNEKVFSKGVKSFNVEDSNDFCLFSDSKETSSKEDTKMKLQQSTNNTLSSLSKSEIHHSNSSSNNNNNKREKLFIEQETPTPQYDNSSNERQKPKKTFEQIDSVMNILNKASSIKKELQPPMIHAPQEVSFWDKFFAPFRCLDNTNQNN